MARCCSWWTSADGYASGATTSPEVSPWLTYRRILLLILAAARQMRVTGSLNEATFTGSTMLVASGGLCVGVSKAALKSAGATVGDQVLLSIVAAAS